MKKYCSALLLCQLLCFADTPSLQPRLTSKDIEAHTHYWISELPNLSGDELSLLANYLYFSSLYFSYEKQCRKALVDTYSNSILINRALITNLDDAKKIAQITADIYVRFKNEFLPAREYSIQSIKACINEVAQNGTSTVKKIISSLEAYSQAISVQYVKQDQSFIDKAITNSKESLQVLNPKLNESHKILCDILEDKNPYRQEGKSPLISDLETSLSVADSTLSSLHEIALNAVNIKRMSIDLLTINETISIIFYNALHQHLQQKNNEPIRIMFDKNGLINSDQRDEYLPPLNQDFKLSPKHLTP